MSTASVCSLLGLTQQELAGLLGVSRSQLAMFETGKRGLPVKATELLAQLLTHAQDAKTVVKVDPNAARQQSHRRQHIERLLVENEYQRLTIEKKVAAAERKVTAHVNLSKLANEVLQTTGKSADTNRKTFFAHKSAQVESADAGANLVKLQLKQELLDVERKYLESLLRKS